MDLETKLNRREFLQYLAALSIKSQGNLERLFNVEKEITIQSTFLRYHEISFLKLKTDLLNLINQGYQPISLETLIGTLDDKITIPQGLSTFFVTFDDGLASQYEQGAKALEEVEKETGWFIPVTLFAMTKFENLPLPIEEIPEETPSYNDRAHRYLTKRQLIEMIKKGHRVENHTVNHADLRRLSDGARNAEMIEGKNRIRALWKLAGREKKYSAFAYPYGIFEGQVEYVKNLNYDVAFSNLPTISHSSLNRYFLGRIRG